MQILGRMQAAVEPNHLEETLNINQKKNRRGEEFTFGWSSTQK